MDYQTFGTRVDTKGNYVHGLALTATTRKQAAQQRSQLCAEMHGKDRVWTAATTYRDGVVYKRQTIPSPVQ